jgi:ABC-type Fe3+/spermidine/putrescine transport system ATPase subunit
MTQAAPAPIVELRDVDKRYGDGPLILDKISFAAERGDFITLIGPSGCGKSTILKLISGLNPISAGRIVVDGRRRRTPSRSSPSCSRSRRCFRGTPSPGTSRCR